MKIKLAFTEKLLWDIYKLIRAKNEIRDVLIPHHAYHKSRAILEMLWPNYYDIKDRYWEQYREKKKRERFANFIYKLYKGGYLKRLKVKDRTAIMLTQKGLERIFTIKLKSTDKGKRKDRKWQMVLFDIPENRRKDRDYFRKGLSYLGYKKLQQSIWVCPYDVLKETKELIERYNLKDFVELLLVKKIGLG